MNYEEFEEFLNKSMHEAVYKDSEGRTIVVITLSDMYGMMNDIIRLEQKK